LKKIIILLLLLAMLLPLVSCGAKYEPQESTEEEARVLFTLSLDGEEYEVRYELYRAFFLSLRDSVDKGDRSVWSGADKQKYVDEIDRKILEYVSDIYASFAVCKKIGFDVYSQEVEEKLEEYIAAGVEGGVALIPTWEGIVTDVAIEGNGSYEDYLKALKQMNLNYSVQILLYRYYIALQAIDTYYIGTFSDEYISGAIEVGAIKYTREDVQKFYNSEDCVRLIRHSLRAEIDYKPEERAERERQSIIDAAASGDEQTVVNAIIGMGATTAPLEIKNGYVVGKNNLDEAYAEEFVREAFETPVGEVSNVIEIHDGLEHTFYVLYRAEKSEENFNDCYTQIAYVYLKDCVGKVLNTAEEALEKSFVSTDALKSLDRSTISMDN